MILSDGGLSTLMNMKLNLELNNFSIETDRQERTSEDSNTVSDGFFFFLWISTVSDGHNETNTLSY